MMFDNLVSSLPFVRAGNLRPLAVGSTARSASLPDVPTLIESGFADFESTAWFALVAPAGTPPDIVARLSEAVAVGLRQPDVAARLARSRRDDDGEHAGCARRPDPLGDRALGRGRPRGQHHDRLSRATGLCRRRRSTTRAQA
ncbi:MAG: tripartite tricarboxylate transporter substrate-binding protein [Pseudomonadota bacterium]